MGRQEYRYRRATRSRLHDYDQPGAYFVTICTFEREVMFGEISGGVMYLDQSGLIVDQCWQRLSKRFRSVSLDAFEVMPNHLHGIVWLHEPGPIPTLSTVVGAFKSEAARRINNVLGTRGIAIWQRSFHDQIIRDDAHLANVRAYITANPTNWPYDVENPVGAGRCGQRET